VGPPTLHRLHAQTVLDDAAIRSAILMGPNARHLTESALDVEPRAVMVTFDLIVLFAWKNEKIQA
jgi:hypothetical protein